MNQHIKIYKDSSSVDSKWADVLALKGRRCLGVHLATATNQEAKEASRGWASATSLDTLAEVNPTRQTVEVFLELRCQDSLIVACPRTLAAAEVWLFTSFSEWVSTSWTLGFGIVISKLLLSADYDGCVWLIALGGQDGFL